MYELLLKDIKTTNTFDELHAIVINIEKNINNRPLTYVKGEKEEEQVLIPTQFCGDKMSILSTDSAQMLKTRS